MGHSSEKQILSIIKFAPPLFTIFLGLIIILFIYFEHKTILKSESLSVRTELMNHNKLMIKKQVNFIYEFIQNSQNNFNKKLQEKLYFDVLYNNGLAQKIYNANKQKSKEEIIKILEKELNKSTISNNLIKIMTDESKPNQVDTFFKNVNLKNENISYTKKFEPLNLYISTILFNKNFEDILKKELLEEIKKFNFGKDSHIFLIDYKGNFLIHINKNLENKNIFLENSAQKIKDETKELISLAQKGNNYIPYSQFKIPNTNILTDKTSYIMGLNDWSWLIGAGFYHRDINLIIQQKTERLSAIFNGYIRDATIIIATISIIMIIISLYFSQLVKRKFSFYKKEIEETHDKNQQYNTMLAQQSKMAAIGEMIGNIAHQWRQPLTVIAMNANNIKVDVELGDIKGDRLNDYTHDILYQTNYLSNTIDDFRNFFKSEDNQSNFTLQEAYNHSLKIINVQFKNHEIQIINNIKNITVTGVFNEFVQVLINIFNNCLDAYVENKIKENKYIFLDSEIIGNDVYFYIQDGAGGVNEAILEKVFEPYFTTKHQSKGTGIGLYMSKEIITKHMKGDLLIENKEYQYNNQTFKGTLLTIKIPLVNE